METLSVKGALRFGWQTFKSRPWLFVQAGILLLLINIAINLVQSVLELGGENLGGVAAILIGFMSAAIGIAVSFLLSMGETAFFLRAHDNTASTSIKDLWHPHPFWKFVGASILSGIAIFVGLLLLVVPGIIAAILFTFIAYIVIEEGKGPVDALKRSMEITKGSRWKLFQLGFVTLLLNIVGLLALVVGLFVTIPVSFLAMTHAYRLLSRKTAAVSEPVGV